MNFTTDDNTHGHTTDCSLMSCSLAAKNFVEVHVFDVEIKASNEFFMRNINLHKEKSLETFTGW